MALVSIRLNQFPSVGISFRCYHTNSTMHDDCVVVISSKNKTQTTFNVAFTGTGTDTDLLI